MVLAGEDLGDPKTADGITEMLRVLRIARVSAVHARAKAFNALKDLIVTVPADLREHLSWSAQAPPCRGMFRLG
jgi:hypothetical protein